MSLEPQEDDFVEQRTARQRAEQVVPYRLRLDTMRFDYLSQNVEHLLGYTPEEINEIGLGSLVKRAVYVDATTDTHQHISDVETAAAQDIRGRIEEYYAEYQLYTKTSSVVWVADHSQPWRDETGAVVGRYGVLTNISWRRASGEAMSRNEDITEAFLDTVNALVVVLDVNGHIVRFNRACEQMTGYLFDEVVGNIFWELLITEREQVEVQAYLTTFFKGRRNAPQKQSDWRIRSGETRRIFWSEAALMDEHGEVVYIVITGTDITAVYQKEQERDRAQQQLRQSEERYRKVVEQVADGIILVDLETRLVLDANPAFLQMVGGTLETLQTRTLYDLIDHDRESVDRNIARIQDRGIHPIGVQRYRRLDGTPLDVQVSVSLMNEAGRGVMCIVVRNMAHFAQDGEEVDLSPTPA